MTSTASLGAAPVHAPRLARVVIPLVASLTLLPSVTSGVALLAGIGLALTLGNPWPVRSRVLAHEAWTWSVVGLGAGMNLAVVGSVGLRGLGYTALGIGGAFILGNLLRRLLGVSPDVSLLVTVGTAICGGSAIAAVAPVVRAKDHDVSVALVTVFLLNAIALFLFPAIGRALHLGQDQFGLWCALAIHDTSSVVGAASQYGERALEVATAAKLARALWIVPVAFALAAVRARVASPGQPAAGAPKRPWFIAGFLAIAALVTFVPSLRGAGGLVSAGAHRLLALTLFLLGLGVSRVALRSLGFRPLLQAIALWVVLGGTTLAAIVHGWIA